MSDATGLAVAQAIRALAGLSTADAIGIAPGKAFTPEEFGALGEALGGVGSAIVLAQRVVDPVQVVRFHDGETSRESRVATSFADAMLRDASWRVVELLRDAGYRAAIARNLRYGGEGTRPHAISFKKAGVLAGLGSVGRSGLLIHPEWGPWLLMSVVVTDAELPSDQPRGDTLCGRCDACIQACPAGALSADGLDREACRNRLGPDGASLDRVLSPHGRISCDECGRACPIGLAPPRLGEGARRERMTIRAVLFDLDNTLIDDDDSVRRAIAAACDEAAALVPGLGVQELTDAYFRISIAIWSDLDLARRTMGPETEVTGAHYRRLCWGQTLAEFGVTEEGVITRVVESYAAWRDRLLLPYPETEETLAALRPHVKLAIITNGTADTHRRKLVRLGYDTAFDYCVVAGEFGPVKPNPAIFLHTAERLGVEPGECMVVGDNAETDVAGARAAGMVGVWLNRGGWPLPPEAPEPDFVIANLRQVLDLLDLGDDDG